VTSKLWWRVTSGLTWFFAMAHTAGMLKREVRGPDEKALLDHMRRYHFEIMGFTRTYWDFFFGFGLFLTAALVVVALLSWKLGATSEEDPALARQLGWPLLVGQVVFAVLSWKYFFLAPGLVSSAASVTTLLALVVRHTDR
jgi:hypothetical protein